MTLKEKRNEIYEFIDREIIKNKTHAWQSTLSDMLKDYAKIAQEGIPPQVIIKEKVVQKIVKLKPENDDDDYWCVKK